jgi:DNA helicase HerA-like ATPase
MSEPEEDLEGIELIRDELSWYRRSCIAKVLKGKHCLVIGATGTGKTWWMSKVAKRYLHRFVFVNPNLEEVVEDICTAHYYEATEVLDGLMNGEIRIEFIPDEDTSIALVQLKELRLGLFEIASEIDVPSGTWWLNFILDEAQSYAWKGSREDVDVFATRGRRYGIRSWFLTQRPQNISSTIINNAQNQIIFRTGPYETPYFKGYKIPIEDEGEWLKKPYHYILYDGFEVKRCDPIK